MSLILKITCHLSYSFILFMMSFEYRRGRSACGPLLAHFKPQKPQNRTFQILALYRTQITCSLCFAITQRSSVMTNNANVLRENTNILSFT